MYSMRIFSFLSFLLTLILLPAWAEAYLDPGTGSMVVQVVIATFAGALYMLKIYWRKIFGMFRRKRDDNDQLER